MSFNLPKYVTVPSAALVRIMDAIKGPHYMILELMATRSIPKELLQDEHPINAIDDVISAYIAGEIPLRSPETNPVVSNVSVNIDKEMLQEAFEGVLKNYERVGAAEADSLLSLMIAESLIIRRWTDNGKTRFSIDRYNHATNEVEVASLSGYDSPRAAISAYRASTVARAKEGVRNV